jgi:hypothetical protein
MDTVFLSLIFLSGWSPQVYDLITIDGTRTPPRVIRSVEQGEFHSPALRYKISYHRGRDNHSFALVANDHRAVIEVAISEFPDLDVSRMLIAPNSPRDPTLVVTIEFGSPITGCTENEAPRESLILVLGRQAEARKWTYTDCESHLVDIHDTSIVRIRRVR